MKIGGYLFCKKDLRVEEIIFKRNKMYKILDIDNNQISMEVAGTPFFNFYINGDNTIRHPYQYGGVIANALFDYFYTETELRSEKLKKINFSETDN